MECDDAPACIGRKQLLDLRVQRSQSFAVSLRVRRNLIRLRGHHRRSALHNGLHNLDGILRVQPGMGVVGFPILIVMVVMGLLMLILGNQINASRAIYHRQIGELHLHIPQIVFHPRAADNQHIRLGKLHHIAG